MNELYKNINDYIGVKCRRCSGIIANCIIEYHRKDRALWNEKNVTCTCRGSVI